MKDKIYLYGAGGHAKVVIGILNSKKRKIDGMFDDDPLKWDKRFINYQILCFERNLSQIKCESMRIIVSIGENVLRRNIVKKIENNNIFNFDTAIHAKAIINERVNINSGTVVMAGAVINCDVIIGKHVIINTSSSIDHDCEIGDYVHISPGVHLGGNVMVGEGSWIGLGSSIINNCTIGRNAIVGAGSVVIKDVPDSYVVVGNPARFLKMNKKC